MTVDEVKAALAATGVAIHDEQAVPVNGKLLPLPYAVVRFDETDEQADLGRVGVTTVRWEVHLFAENHDFALECKIRQALRSVTQKVEVERFPDGKPYQTSFLFTTRHKERTETK